MAITFKVIIPKKLDRKAFDSAFHDAAVEMAKQVHVDFDGVTEKWRSVVDFEEKVSDSPNKVEVSVMTSSIAFKYYDQGNGGPQRIIRPTRAKALHWIDKNTGDDIFRKWVHGYDGRKAVEKIEKIWLKEAPKLFNSAMQDAVAKSGHKI